MFWDAAIKVRDFYWCNVLWKTIETTSIESMRNLLQIESEVFNSKLAAASFGLMLLVKLFGVLHALSRFSYGMQKRFYEVVWEFESYLILSR